MVDDPHHDRIAGYVVTPATAVRRGVQRVVPLAPSPGTPQAANHAPDSAHRRHGPAEDPLQHAGPGCAANRGLLLLPVIDYLSRGARRPARCGLAISYYMYVHIFMNYQHVCCRSKPAGGTTPKVDHRRTVANEIEIAANGAL